MIGVALAVVGQLALYLGAAPLLAGIARWTGRRAHGIDTASIFQEYYDLLKWLYRPPSRPAYGTVFGIFGPPLGLAIVLAAGLEVPSVLRHPPLADGDLLAAVGVLTLSHAAHLLTAYDGAAPAAPGRGWWLPAGLPLVEPIIALALLGRMVEVGSADPAVVAGGGLATPAGALACGALIVLAIAVYEALPVGARGTAGPYGGGTPLALVGRDLAIVRWAALAKAQVVLSLAACAFLPLHSEAGFGSAWALLVACALYLGKLALLAAVCGLGRAAFGRGGKLLGGQLLALATVLALLGLASGAILHA